VPRRYPSGAAGAEGQLGTAGDRGVGAELRGGGNLTVRWSILAQLAENASTRGLYQESGTLASRSNTVFNFETAFDGVDRSGTDYTRNPRFVDPAEGDFTLAGNSQEVDQANGSDIQADRNGDPRGILRDRGAFER
jgi:hypothetical protein